MEDDWLLVLGAVVAVGAAIGAGLVWLAFSGGFPQRLPYQPATVSNVERWELIEDEAGNLKGIIVHRERKVKHG